MKYSNFIEEALKEVAEIARSSFGKVSGTVKEEDNNQVLTETDLDIGQNLIAKISKAFPQHNIIDEEAGVIDNNSNYTWVIDPIDGTSNFANGVPTYGIMFGLLENNIPTAGGIALPQFSEIYVAEKGEGIFCNGEKIQVSNEKELKNIMLAYNMDGHPEDPDFTRKECALLAEIILNIRNLRDSGSVFDLAMTAQGKYGAHLNRSSKVWDNVAQQIIIEEAGGIYTDFFGEEIDYSNILTDSQRNFTFCAATPEIHKQLMAIVSKS